MKSLFFNVLVFATISNFFFIKVGSAFWDIMELQKKQQSSIDQMVCVEAVSQLPREYRSQMQATLGCR